MSRLAVIGTGYVGLTTGAVLAHLGHEVTCADVVPEKIEALNEGRVPFHENGLEDLVREGVGAGRLHFVVGAAAAVPEAEFVFLCVPTPQGDDGRPDMTFIEAAAREIGPRLASEAIVVTKSTVPVGSSHIIEGALGREDVFVVSNPEFLREGSAVHDCLHPDRIVVGSHDQAVALRVATLFENLNARVLITDPASAETLKYACNAFLATKVSFINAVANLCEVVGADVRDVALGMGYDKRIGLEFLKPGPGWGGSCFPKDTRALVAIGEDAGYDFALLKGAIEVNEEQYDRVVDKVVAMADGSVTGKTVAMWGLAFKARTDDTRDSPALAVAARLAAKGATVKAYDPAVQALPDAPGGPEVEVCADPYAACDGAAVLAVLTEWDEFRWLDLAKVASLMTAPRIVDTRNLLDPAAVRKRGFRYDSIGRV
jgi:UDPglucose 6-dehydrogenase